MAASTSSPSSTASSSSSSSTSTSTPPTLTRYQRTLADEQVYQEAQYQKTEDVPGCMQLFDEFLMCNALGPHIRNIYRYGSLKDCSWRWEDFKYCMSLKGEDEDAKKRLWTRRRAEWWAARRAGGSSEDVWDVRTGQKPNYTGQQQQAVTTENSTA